MPRHFSDEEKQVIEQKLLDTAKELFVKFGVNKTNISDITEASGVGKGTFYRFFNGKGEIYVKAYEDEWKKVRDELDGKYINMKGELSEIILQYITENQKALLEHPLLSIVYDRSTLAMISDRYVLKSLEEFAGLINQRLVVLIESWIKSNDIDCNIDVEVIAGMMKCISVLNYHQDEIGVDVFGEVRNKIAEGIGLVISGRVHEHHS